MAMESFPVPYTEKQLVALAKLNLETAVKNADQGEYPAAIEQIETGLSLIHRAAKEHGVTT